MKQKKRKFTLIELLVITTITAIYQLFLFPERSRLLRYFMKQYAFVFIENLKKNPTFYCRIRNKTIVQLDILTV